MHFLGLLAAGVMIPLWFGVLAYLVERNKISSWAIVVAIAGGTVFGVAGALVLGLAGDSSYLAAELLAIAGLAVAPMALVIGLAPARA